MIAWMEDQSPVIQALIATMFTWGMTALGAAPVLFMKKPNKRLLDAMLGFAGGIMLAAACWSLIIPAIERAEIMGMHAVAIVSAGFVAGGAFMLAGDRWLAGRVYDDMDKCSRTLMFSITLHNIPEGLCIGVAFGAAAVDIQGANLWAACMLALGIGLQNFPEGAAVSLPMVRNGISRKKAFMMGQISGMVEPVAAMLGAIMVIQMRALLPAMLAFAAGAMVYAVAGEVFPESCSDDGYHNAAFAAIVGFAIMMAMDVLLG